MMAGWFVSNRSPKTFTGTKPQRNHESRTYGVGMSVEQLRDTLNGLGHNLETISVSARFRDIQAAKGTAKQYVELLKAAKGDHELAITQLKALSQ